MKTDHLINAIVEDRALRAPALFPRVMIALASGGAASTLLFGLALGVRPDIGSALATWRFLLKLVLVATSLALGLWASARLAHPDANLRRVGGVLFVVPVLLVTGVGLELTVLPSEAWYTRAIGSNSRICLTAVPLLSVIPLTALLVALRAGAPRSPSSAGAVAGLLAGGLAATLYATHCVDDSPLFVALWYTPAVAIVMLAGAIAGRRLLRW
jgi:hypothetical protein